MEERAAASRGAMGALPPCLVSSNLERTFRASRLAMEKLRTEPQWVPVSWVY